MNRARTIVHRPVSHRFSLAMSRFPAAKAGMMLSVKTLDCMWYFGREIDVNRRRDWESAFATRIITK